MAATKEHWINSRPSTGRANSGRFMDKNLQLLFWGTGLTLSSAGLVWMITTLISVDKRTEVIDVKMEVMDEKIDHLVEVVTKLSTRQAQYDKSWSNVVPSHQASAGEN